MKAAPRGLGADDRLHRAPLRRNGAEIDVAAILDLEIEALSVRRPEEIADAPVEIGREAPRLALGQRDDHELVAVRLVSGTPRRAIREILSVGRESRMRIGGRIRRDLPHLAPRERHAPDLLVVRDRLIDVLLAGEIESGAVGRYFIIAPGGSEPIGERVEFQRRREVARLASLDGGVIEMLHLAVLVGVPVAVHEALVHERAELALLLLLVLLFDAVEIGAIEIGSRREDEAFAVRRPNHSRRRRPENRSPCAPRRRRRGECRFADRRPSRK